MPNAGSAILPGAEKDAVAGLDIWLIGRLLSVLTVLYAAIQWFSVPPGEAAQFIWGVLRSNNQRKPR